MWFKARLNLIETDNDETEQYLSLLISNWTAEVELAARHSIFENITSQNWNAIIFSNVKGIIEYIKPCYSSNFWLSRVVRTMIIKRIALTTFYLLLITESLKVSHKFLLCKKSKRTYFFCKANSFKFLATSSPKYLSIAA
jgi:hypothetical protein